MKIDMVSVMARACARLTDLFGRLLVASR